MSDYTQPAPSVLEQLLTGAREDLHPDLAAALHTPDDGLAMIKHPLINQFYCGELDHPRLNEGYRQKQAELDRARSEGDWTTVLNITERPWRPDALASIMDSMLPQEFAEALGWVWTDTEIVHQCAPTWHALWHTYEGCPRPEHLMNRAERLKLGRLPEYITVYRGASALEGEAFPFGRSWTLGKGAADWFAKRFDDGTGGMKVFKRMILKKHALAYFAGRGESEIILSTAALELIA